MSELVPCKKCGSLPKLHTPSKYDDEYRFSNWNQSLGGCPPPYYRCEMCLHLAKTEEEKRRVEQWNERQK
jgi:hypothetical protein